MTLCAKPDSRVDTILAKLLPPLERWLGKAVSEPVTRGLIEFLVFGIKQAWACLFGGLLLVGIIATAYIYPETSPLSRYDALVLYAVAIQVLFLITRLERPSEALVILIFHIVGTLMEIFKTNVGSWTYPEESLLRIGNVPLFSGFMYAAVGSYLARANRVFDFRWEHYPWRGWTALLAALIYLNFFTHHYFWDLRYGLFAATIVLFWRAKVHYRVWRWRHKMPLLFGFILISLFLWIAENIGTYTRTWLYPGQGENWHMVSLNKMGSWYLLMIMSWVLVTLVHRPRTAQKD